MRNRRECVRCSLVGISLEPAPHGETLDVSEGGLAWISSEPFVPGEVVTIEAPALFEALGLPVQRIQARVRDLEFVDGDHYRIGAALVAPSERVVMALRRAVLNLQRKGDELDSHVVDMLIMASSGD